jgi:transposase
MANQGGFQLKRQVLGAIPVIDPFINKIGLLKLLSEAMGNERYAEAIILLVKNVMIERNALYAVKEWSAQFDPALIHGGNFGDDSLARALDRLFDADRASLQTHIVLGAVKAFEIDLGEIHQDTTSVTVSGNYAEQNKKAVQLKRGHSKDHRPDLKQLVYELSISRDGAIPIHYKIHDGNRTDDTLHWENWQSLRGIIGRSDFLYVADSKLCVSKILLSIDRAQGRFITIMPRTRAEVKEFGTKVETSFVRWEKVFAKRCSRKSKRINLFEVATGIYQMREGFKIFWYRSSEKSRRDWNAREERITSAMDHLRSLADPMKKKKPKTEAAIKRRADKIISRFDVGPWIKVDIALERVEKFKQLKRGRAGEDTAYRKLVHFVPRISCSRNENAIAQSEAMDGIFPLVTNTELDASAVLKAYKYQPQLEKRHALLKSGLAVAPIFLKKNDRIEALMFVYFIAQLLCAILERELKQEMNKRNIHQIQVLPEERPSTNPTAEQVLRIFQSCARHLLFSRRGGVSVQTFADPLSKIQQQVLELLSVPLGSYG